MKVPPKYFICDRGALKPRTWNPRLSDPTFPFDCRYYGRVFQEMERTLTLPNLRFYVTWDIDQLPEYGENVVVLLLSDERGLMPRYARCVRAVLKVMAATFPEADTHHWWVINRLNVLLAVKYLRNVIYSLRSHLRERLAPPRWQAVVRKKPLILLTPLGYGLLEDVPMKTMTQRPFHCFYAGNTKPAIAASGFRKWLGTPKEVARNAMWQAIGNLTRNNRHFRFDGSVVDDPSHPNMVGGRTYTERMMDSKICLAPRGSSVHSWRFFEGIKSGCLVVTEHLPKRHYYRDAPILELEEWNQLEEKIEPYLQNEVSLERVHLQTIDFWNERCSEAAIGSYIARCLDADRDIYD